MRWVSLGIAAMVVAGAASIAAAQTKTERESNTLYIGDRVISVHERMLLTREQSVVDFEFSPHGDSVAFVAHGPGTAYVSIVSPGADRSLKVELSGTPSWLSWSPDGKNLAVCTRGRGRDTPTALWLVSAQGGEPRRLLAGAQIGTPVWSPDGKALALGYRERAAQGAAEAESDILLLNVADGTQRLVGERGTDLRFSPDVKFLQFRTSAKDTEGRAVYQMVQYDLATGEKKRRAMRFGEGFFSPDGNKFVIQTAQPYGDLVVRDVMAGPPVRLTWNGSSKFAAWSPDSQMIAYIRKYPVSDDRGEALVSAPTLWITAAAGADTGRQIVASPWVDEGSAVKWSPVLPPGMAVAFLADGNLCGVGLDARLMRVRERLSVGLPVTQEAVRQEALSNIRQIGLALLMYVNDHDEAFPPREAEMQRLLEPYLKSQQMFYHPAETDKFIFKYLLEEPRTADEIDDAATTPMALLDLDEEWEVVCFADGHSVVRRKQR